MDCSATVSTALQECLERMADKTGDRVTIVGQSRGGIIARSLAVQRPDLVAGIVTLGSPVRGMLNVHPVVLGSIGMVGALGTLKVPHLFTWRCWRGDCCSEFRRALQTQRWPEDVGYTAVYSKRDGIVQWRACLDPCADEYVEVVLVALRDGVPSGRLHGRRPIAGDASGTSPTCPSGPTGPRRPRHLQQRGRRRLVGVARPVQRGPAVHVGVREVRSRGQLGKPCSRATTSWASARRSCSRFIRSLLPSSRGRTRPATLARPAEAV